MWALGCIIAEMFINKPLLAGSSTVDQLEKILSITGSPNDTVIAGMDSKFAKSMIDECKKKVSDCPEASTHHRKSRLQAMMHGVAPDVIDIVCLMLDIDQKERMTVQEALSHSYMKPFRKDDEEACDICPVRALPPTTAPLTWWEARSRSAWQGWCSDAFLSQAGQLPHANACSFV